VQQIKVLTNKSSCVGLFSFDWRWTLCYDDVWSNEEVIPHWLFQDQQPCNYIVMCH